MGKVTWFHLPLKMYSQVNTAAPEGMLLVPGGLEQPDPPASPHGTEQRLTVPPSHPMPHLFRYRTMAGERATSPGNPGGLSTLLHIPFWQDFQAPTGPGWKEPRWGIP